MGRPWIDLVLSRNDDWHLQSSISISERLKPQCTHRGKLNITFACGQIQQAIEELLGSINVVVQNGPRVVILQGHGEQLSLRESCYDPRSGEDLDDVCDLLGYTRTCGVLLTGISRPCRSQGVP